MDRSIELVERSHKSPIAFFNQVLEGKRFTGEGQRNGHDETETSAQQAIGRRHITSPHPANEFQRFMITDRRKCVNLADVLVKGSHCFLFSSATTNRKVDTTTASDGESICRLETRAK